MKAVCATSLSGGGYAAVLASIKASSPDTEFEGVARSSTLPVRFLLFPPCSVTSSTTQPPGLSLWKWAPPPCRILYNRLPPVPGVCPGVRKPQGWDLTAGDGLDFSRRSQGFSEWATIGDAILDKVVVEVLREEAPWFPVVRPAFLSFPLFSTFPSSSISTLLSSFLHLHSASIALTLLTAGPRHPPPLEHRLLPTRWSPRTSHLRQRRSPRQATPSGGRV